MVSFPRERFDLSRKPYNALLDEISTRVSSQQYETWFRNLPIHFASPDKIIITTANRFSKTWIERKFRDVISSSAKKVFGITPRIEIILHSESSKPPSDVPAGTAVEEVPAAGAPSPGAAAHHPAVHPQAMHPPPAADPASVTGDFLTSIAINRE